MEGAGKKIAEGHTKKIEGVRVKMTVPVSIEKALSS